MAALQVAQRNPARSSGERDAAAQVVGLALTQLGATAGHVAKLAQLHALSGPAVALCDAYDAWDSESGHGLVGRTGRGVYGRSRHGQAGGAYDVAKA